MFVQPFKGSEGETDEVWRAAVAPCGPTTAAEVVKYQKSTSGGVPLLRKTQT